VVSGVRLGLRGALTPAIAVLVVASACGAAPPDPSHKGPIVFQTNRPGNEEIYLRDEQGGLTNLTRHSSDDTYPSFSPDGKRIVFTSNRDGGERIYVMNLDGSGVTPLISSDAGPVNYAHFSGDGKRILFTGPFEKKRENLYLFDRATKQVTGPVGPTGVRCQWGNISRDGRIMAFMQFRKKGGNLPEGWYVTVMDMTTGAKTVVDNGCEPCLSPDATKVVYVHFQRRSDHTDLYAYDIATRQKVQMTDVRGYPYSPRYSADGQRIIFASSPVKDRPRFWELYLMAATPLASPVQLTKNDVEEVHPDIR